MVIVILILCVVAIKVVSVVHMLLRLMMVNDNGD
nr:MAG TPA_asm: hypothetical protein [Bacteriophage sp.]